MEDTRDVPEKDLGLGRRVLGNDAGWVIPDAPPGDSGRRGERNAGITERSATVRWPWARRG